MGIQKTNKGCFIIGVVSAVALISGIVIAEELIRKRKVKKYRLTEGFDDYSDCPYEIEPDTACNTTETSECEKDVCEGCEYYGGTCSEASDDISCEE